MRAPEALLGHPWSSPLDVWSVGCIVFEFLTGAPMFALTAIETGVQEGARDYEEAYLQLLFAQHGREAFKPDFIARCTRSEPYFHENGTPRFVPNVMPITVAERMSAFGYREADVAEAARFIERCLIIDPQERPSAADLLDDKWLNGGGDDEID
ncbi:kinase-like protein [Exidia glandulosa HHB12029]|uniref:Kinase-like protein n=1 Tax=Exidia glandulosa HHB12029 TaxID=1314781 RepID=A0A165NB13_EXIGL|nr:kinase-like protein [Exidia glandulosa HHB12029]